MPIPIRAPKAQTAAASEPSNDTGRILRAVLKHKWWIALIVGACVGASYFRTNRIPRLYQASCLIEYDMNPQRPLGKEVEDTSTPMASYWAGRDYAETQNRIIASRQVSERVVRKLGLHQDPDFMGIPPEQRKKWRGGEVIAAAQSLQANIRVTTERDTYLVNVKVTNGNPERAALLANAVADAYIEKTLEDRLGSSTNALDWLGRQLDTLKLDLERAEMSLHHFVEDDANLSMPLEDQQALLSNDIQRLNSRLGETHLLSLELAAHLESLRKANREDPLQVLHPEVTDRAAIADLRSKYFQLDAQRRALTVKYGDAHPQIQAIDAQLPSLRDQVRTEIDGIIAAAEARLNEAQSVEIGIRASLDLSNSSGLALSLQEITYRRLERERDNAARLYGTILQRTAEADLTKAVEVSTVRLIDRALPPSFAVYPSYRRNLTIGALIGVLLGTLLAFVLSQLDRIIRTVEDAEALGLTILGIIPRIDDGEGSAGPVYGRRARRKAPGALTSRDLVVHTHPKSSVAECCRTIRTNLTFIGAEHPQKVLVVTSASPREGKTTVVISLAISLAQSGQRVLLADTDLRKPRVHKALGLQAARGITSVLVGEQTLDAAIQRTEVSGLDFLASGPIPPNPSELLHTEQFRSLLADLAKRYDYVLLDSPPLGAVTDAAVMAPQVDGVIVVLHGQRTTREAARSALRQLRDVNAHITGSVLNDVVLSGRRYGYGSYYYYHNDGYYQADPDPRSERPAAES